MPQNPSKMPGSTYWRELQRRCPSAFGTMADAHRNKLIAGIDLTQLSTRQPRRGFVIENGLGLRRKVTSFMGSTVGWTPVNRADDEETVISIETWKRWLRQGSDSERVVKLDKKMMSLDDLRALQ